MTEVTITALEIMRLTGIYPLSDGAFRDLLQHPDVKTWLKAGQPRDEHGKPV